jgi:hypothetical protein
MTSTGAGRLRRAAAGAVAATLVAGLSVALPAGPAAAADGEITATVGYTCATDVYRLTFQDLDADGPAGHGVPYGVGFVVNGTTEVVGSSMLGSPEMAVWEDNTDDVGAHGVSFEPGDQVEVWLEEWPDGEPTPASIKANGRKIGDSFTYCGIGSSAKKAVLTDSAARSFSYKGATGQVGYSCKVAWGNTHVGALSSRVTRAATVPMQLVFVHKGGAGALGGTFASLRPTTYVFKTLMPRLAKGDRIDVYAVPYAWLLPWPTYPDAALAAKAKKNHDAELIYSFSYGTCGALPVPGTDQCASKPGVQSKPCPPLYMATVRWPKSSHHGATYQVQICRVGKSCTPWHSTGKKRKATFKDLHLGKHVVKIRSVTKSGVSKPLKLKFTVTTKFRLSK